MINNLMQRQMVMANRCCMWLREGESVAHWFIHCPVAKELWNAFLISWGMSWVILSTVVELIQV